MKFCNPKVKLLTKQTPKPEFTDTEIISINLKFDNNMLRIPLIPVVSAAKMASEGVHGGKSIEDVDEEVMKLRALQTDAIIVRIMKGRKKEKNNELIEQVIRQTTMFQAQPAMIKRRIESLIEKEYLARDPTDRSTLIY